MNKIILSVLCIILSLTFFPACKKNVVDEYAPIESTKDDLRVVGSIKGFDIYYDEVRCAALTAKELMAKEYGINWSKPEEAEKYRAELEKRVFEGLLYNYAVQLLLKESAYTLNDENIQNAVQNEIKLLIDECGGRKKYQDYLNNNHLTDRVVRFNLAISCALNELVFLLNDQGAFDEYVNFDLERVKSDNNIYYSEEDFFEAYLMLLGGDIFLRSEDIFIPSNTEGGASLAQKLLDEAKKGKDLQDIAKANGLNHETLYQFKGELDPKFFEAVLSLEENEYGTVQLDTGWYVIKRLPPEEQYVYLNCYDLAYDYLFLKMSEIISDYEKTLSIEFTDFGKSLDITKIN